MSTTAQGKAAAIPPAVPVVLVAERPGRDSHLMVAAYLDPERVAALRGKVADLLGADGLWCGAAAATPRCRDGLLRVVTSGGVGRSLLTRSVSTTGVKLARRVCARWSRTPMRPVWIGCCWSATTLTPDRTPPGPLRLARAAGATPTLRCAHADAEPLTVVAEILLWCWTRGGEHRRAIAPALTSVHLV